MLNLQDYISRFLCISAVLKKKKSSVSKLKRELLYHGYDKMANHKCFRPTIEDKWQMGLPNKKRQLDFGIYLATSSSKLLEKREPVQGTLLRGCGGIEL